jgi:hypothetical protein
VQAGGSEARLVLRLWPAAVTVTERGNALPLFLGSIRLQRTARWTRWFTITPEAPPPSSALAEVRQALAAAGYAVTLASRDGGLAAPLLLAQGGQK